jgi:biopolymer transport protein ExbB/TolQ
LLYKTKGYTIKNKTKMETLYFTLGIASVVVTVIAVGAVWAMFKVAKLNARLNDVEQQFASTHQDIDMVERTMSQQMNHTQRDQDDRFVSFERNIQEMFHEADRQIRGVDEQVQRVTDELYRHIDSRIDKLAAKQEKQLIKG